MSGGDLPIALVVCRVWDPAEYPPALAQLHHQIIADAAAEGVHLPSQPYPDSIEGHCRCCGTRVAIGLRQQQHLALFGKAPHAIVCLICATIVSGGGPDGISAGDLGPNWHQI